MLGTAFSKAGTGRSQGGQLCFFNSVHLSHALSGMLCEHSGAANSGSRLMSLRMSHHVSILSYHQSPLQHGLTQINLSGPSFSVTMPRLETLFTCTLFCRASVSCIESLSKPGSGTTGRLATQGESLMSDGFWRWTDRKKVSGALLRLSQNTKLFFFFLSTE